MFELCKETLPVDGAVIMIGMRPFAPARTLIIAVGLFAVKVMGVRTAELTVKDNVVSL